MNEEWEVFIGSSRIHKRKFSLFPAVCVGVSIIVVLLSCTIIVLLGSNNEKSELKWNSLWFSSVGSESCVRLIDINGDGLNDVIVAVAEITEITGRENAMQNRSGFCKSLNIDEPCSGVIYGIRGYDFQVLWSIRVRESIFELLCSGVDIDGDGRDDCIAAGRRANIVAFDPRKGQVFWSGSKIKARRNLWNFYNPIILPIDVDHDNQNDILISHGGNPTIPSEVHEREAGCLLILSSRTGEQIGEPFWMPDGKETYMSPVLYGRSTVLFGSGGETVGGGLYSISVDDIINERNRHVSVVHWCGKGVMVPPIILDVDHDGVDDILVSCFDGSLELILGRTMKPLWSRIFRGFEFYASPTPGHFNDDSFVDFFIIVNYGEWDRYVYSTTMVLDGLTGETLWSENSSVGEFASPLTLQMRRNGKNEDAFVYRLRSVHSEGNKSNVSAILLHGIGLQDGEISKNDRNVTAVSSLLCDPRTLDESVVNVFLTNIDHTEMIGSIYPPILDEKSVCSKFEPMYRSSGAIGDLNGDGIYDIVDITTFMTKLGSHSLENLVVHSVLTRFSLFLHGDDYQIVANYQENISNRTIDKNLIHQLKKTRMYPQVSMYNKQLSVNSKQTWSGYLGVFGNSHYYRDI